MKGWSFLVTLIIAVLVLPGTAIAAKHTIPLFPSASNVMLSGFARVINHSGRSGTVSIFGIDDAGSERGPIELALAAGAVAHFNSTDLERGNALKGLTGELGEGKGDWRLRLESDLSIQVLPFMRTGDGFVTTMHEVVPTRNRFHYVPFFNPGSNAAQVSRLRIINPNDEEVEITVRGRDDNGDPAPGGAVGLTLGANAARTVSARALEEGNDDLEGSLGDGQGKWQLFVVTNGGHYTIDVMNLLASPTGHLANLSGFDYVSPFTSGCAEYTVIGSGNDAVIESVIPYFEDEDGQPHRVPLEVLGSEYAGYVLHLLEEGRNMEYVRGAIIITAPADTTSISFGICSTSDMSDEELLDPDESAFHDGPAYTAADVDALTGTVTFKGLAYGHTGGWNRNSQYWPEPSASDFTFLGTITLTVDFGDGDEPGLISATISDLSSSLDPGPDDDRWEDIVLGGTPLYSASADFASMSDSVTVMVTLVEGVWDIDEETGEQIFTHEGSYEANATGSWRGTFRGNGPSNTPFGVTGTFSATSHPNDPVGISISGSFGATQQ